MRTRKTMISSIRYLLYRLLDYRNVYLGMSSKPGRYKIGIARKVEDRWQDIDKKIQGSREKCVFHARCFFAGRLERFLLRRYKGRAVRQKGWGREWRRLNLVQRVYVIGVIACNSFLGSIALALIAVWLLAMLIG